MHSLKILPLSPPSPRCPAIVVRHIRLWFLATPPRSPSGPSASHPPPSFRSALSRPPPAASPSCAVSLPSQSRTLRAVIVVLVLWLVRETFSGLLLG